MKNIPALIESRAATHGDFKTRSEFAQHLKMLFQDQPGAAKLEAHQAEALEMIATKISRILHGDPQVADHWIDIAGYAQLGSPSSV